MNKFPATQVLLFITTCFTTLFAGAVQQGVDPIAHPASLILGLPFSLTLMFILLFHESGHYLTAIFHKTEATLPYFIPGIPPIGTFGAFIKMKSPIYTRGALIDIGASGPIAGFVVSLIASVVGLSMSEVVNVNGNVGMTLGDSLLFTGLSRLIVGHDVLLHPIAFAGWFGFFVTSMNLIPVGQLDGGHILYAFAGKKQKNFSYALVAVMSVLGYLYWPGWLVWAVLLLLLGIKHPPVMYWEEPLDPRRRNIGIASLIIFILTFIPAPFNVNY